MVCSRTAVAAQEGKTPLDRAKDDATRAGFVPADVALLLSSLSLSKFGHALCSQLGMASAADATLLTDVLLQQIGMLPLQRGRLLQAVAAGVAAPAPAPPVPAPLSLAAGELTDNRQEI